MSPLARGLVAERPPPPCQQPGQDRAGAPWIVVRIRWELTADQTSGSRVTVTASVPSRLADLRAKLLAAYQTHLELFFAALNGDVRPWPAERTEELEKRYAERLDGGASATPSPVIPGA